MKAVPVLLRFPSDLTGRPAVATGRAHATLACGHSARLGGAAHLSLARDHQGAPLPELGWHWSRSHTTGLAAGLVAAHPVGIDVECLDRPRLEALRVYLLDRRLPVDGSTSNEELLGLWTALEALAKLCGQGVAALPRCRVVAAFEGGYDMRLDGERYTVQRTRADRHVIAVARPAAHAPVCAPVELQEVLA